LVQFILVPVNYTNPEEVSMEELYSEVSERGEGGFGSTGLK
jgi:dUTPase